MNIIGIQSYRDLTPPEYWHNAPDADDIAAELADKYRPAAIAELQAACEADEINGYGETEIWETALEIAAEHGETVTRIMRQMEADRADWLAGWHISEWSE